MQDLLAERKRIRNKAQANHEGERSKELASERVQTNGGSKDLDALVKSVKRKMDQNQRLGKKRSRR